jgi:phosphoribosylformimino-5-aminoimidazole carboxamide ribotide isomerase
MMEAIPAIDIAGGRAVRLLKGDFANSTDYGEPLAHAERLVNDGATRLHVVDLDAARTGDASNIETVIAIARRAGVPIEVGGGVRDRDRAERLLDAGVDRVVIGTAGVENPELVIALATQYPNRIVLGLDHRRVELGGKAARVVAVRGWEQESGLELLTLLGRYDGAALAAVIITDITVDGTLEGPDVEGYRLVLDQTSIPVIASGGIGNLEHLRALAAIDVGKGLSGVVIGKALYEGKMTVREAIEACAASV